LCSIFIVTNIILLIFLTFIKILMHIIRVFFLSLLIHHVLAYHCWKH
jgi:hypothetical protein